MRRMLPAALLLVVALPACGGEPSSDADGPPASAGASASFSTQVRTNFLDSCVDNAANTSNGAASPEQLRQTCECILGKVEQEYSADEFAEFEKRLLAGGASAEESGRLTTWSTDCAREAAAG